MKNRHIGFGIFLLSIGVVLLLVNIGVISWSIFGTLLEFWPVILIVIGVNIIFRQNEIVRIATWLLFLAALIAYSYFNGGTYGLRNNNWVNNTNVIIEKSSVVERGDLKIALGGTTLNLGSSSLKLIDASVPDNDIVHRESYTNGGKTALLEFKQDNNYFFRTGREDCKFNINDDMVWDMDIDTGAVNGTLDMSNLKIGELDIDIGAADLKLIFGEKYKTTDVNINAGASSFEIYLPKNAGARINIDGALNNTNLSDLGWNRDKGYYTSPNYNSAECKINIDVDMGVGKLVVNVQ